MNSHFINKKCKIDQQDLVIKRSVIYFFSHETTPWMNAKIIVLNYFYQKMSQKVTATKCILDACKTCTTGKIKAIYTKKLLFEGNNTLVHLLISFWKTFVILCWYCDNATCVHNYRLANLFTCKNICFTKKRLNTCKRKNNPKNPKWQV